MSATAAAWTRRLMDGLPTGILVCRADGVVEYANPRAEEILGQARAALDGARVDDVLAPLDRLRTVAASAVAGAGELPPRGPDTAPIGFRIGEVEAEAGGPPSYAVVFQDLGPVQRLREERNRLLQLAAVGEVLPAILHEIKNPLAGISTAVEVLLEEVPEGHVRRELLAVLGEVRRIKLTLEGIGVFRQTGRATRRAPVHKALREAFLVVEPQMRAKGIRGVQRIPDLPPLPFDAAMMRAFLFNLVTNSIHASSEGDEITVTLRLQKEGLLELTVADTGAGMSPEVLAHCRELFFTTKPTGSGVGLALCARTVEQSGGSMDIASQEGRGTTVTLRLPIGRAEPGAPAPVAS